jgi:hypothetical protein
MPKNQCVSAIILIMAEENIVNFESKDRMNAKRFLVQLYEDSNELQELIIKEIESRVLDDRFLNSEQREEVRNRILNASSKDDRIELQEELIQFINNCK